MLTRSRYIKDVVIEEHGKKSVLLFITSTGTLKILDMRVWQLVKSGNISLLPKTVLEELKKHHILVPSEENEFTKHIQDNKKSMAASTQLYVVIQPTAFCSFGCGYCGQEHSPQKMSEETADRVFNTICEKIKTTDRYKGLSIGWFGSEPLSGLTVIKNISKRFVAFCDALHIRFSAKMVTNGFLLTPPVVEALTQRCHVNFFEITLDGTAEYHDQRRHTKNGKPTFDIIYKNMLHLARTTDARISIRCNVDRYNYEGVTPLIKKLAEDGLADRVIFYCAPIHSWGNDAHLRSEEKLLFAVQEVEWLMELYQNGFKKVSFLPQRKKKVCIAVTPDEELFDPFGSVFKCTEVSLTPFYEKEGKNSYAVGSVDAPHSIDLQKNAFGDFYRPETIDQFHCPTCVVFPLCGGACPKEWMEGRVPCPSFKFNLQERMLIQYLREQSSFLKDLPKHMK